MAYQHREDGTLVLDREAAQELALLLWETAQELRAGTNRAYTGSLVTRLELSAAALVPFPPEEQELMETFRKIVRAGRRQGKKHPGLMLSVADVRALAALPVVQELARAETLAFCQRTRHRKQRSGLCTCQRGW